MAIKKDIDTSACFIHLVEMGRVLHWIGTRPDEWKQMVGEIEKSDCLIFGRTQTAFLTHPQALITTEKISNQVVSYVLKKDMDVSAGSKSFSRSAAQYILDHCQPDNSFGSDAEWPIRLKQAGFRLEYIQVEGLDLESGDQFQFHAANAVKQAQAAMDYDADPKNWSNRIEIANEIIKTAIEVSQNKYPMVGEHITEPKDFDCAAVFDIDDYLYFYSEALTDERTDMEVNALVRLLELDQPKKILDLACGFGRHKNRLAVMGHKMTGIDLTEGFLKLARQDAVARGVQVNYQQGDMRQLKYK